jgi:hypothetical protein
MKRCENCKEELEADDDVTMMNVAGNLKPMHRNCQLRLIIGSVAHIERRCSCFVPGSDENDPPGMTIRQAADAAAEAFRRQREGVN